MAKNPLRNITIEGVKYDVFDIIPKEKDKLLYSYDEQTLEADYLRYEEALVCENQEDYDKCIGDDDSGTSEIMKNYFLYTYSKYNYTSNGANQQYKGSLFDIATPYTIDGVTKLALNLGNSNQLLDDVAKNPGNNVLIDNSFNWDNRSPYGGAKSSSGHGTWEFDEQNNIILNNTDSVSTTGFLSNKTYISYVNKTIVGQKYKDGGADWIWFVPAWVMWKESDGNYYIGALEVQLNNNVRDYPNRTPIFTSLLVSTRKLLYGTNGLTRSLGDNNTIHGNTINNNSSVIIDNDNGNAIVPYVASLNQVGDGTRRNVSNPGTIDGAEVLIKTVKKGKSFQFQFSNVTPYNTLTGADAEYNGNILNIYYDDTDNDWKCNYSVPDGGTGTTVTDVTIPNAAKEVLEHLGDEVHIAYQTFTSPFVTFKNIQMVSYDNNKIIRLDENKVYEYDDVNNAYVLTNELPLSLFTGSHISYNEITGKLFYSNGKEITKIGTEPDTTPSYPYKAGNLITINPQDTINADIPTKQHELIYSEDDKSLVTRQLMVPEIYVVDNDADFELCKGTDVAAPKIRDEWQQYSENASMPEYGIGASTTTNTHVGLRNYSNSNTRNRNNSGYGRWEADADNNITNDKNSCDYNAFINPFRTNKFNYTTIIGTNKGKTSGDWGGVALVDDSNAHPRAIICSDGKVYERDARYDLTKTQTNSIIADQSIWKKETFDGVTRENLWLAWVREYNGRAYIIYSNQESYTPSPNYNEAKCKDNIPAVGTKVQVYRADKIATKSDRINVIKENNNVVEVTQTREAYGWVTTLNVLVQNTSGIHGLHYDGVDYEKGKLTTETTNYSQPACSIGTVQIFTEVWPCDGSFLRSRTETGWGATEEPKQCHFVTADGILLHANSYSYNHKDYTALPSNYQYMKGTNLVKYNSNYNCDNTSLYTFVRTNVEFNNGKLTLQFSDSNNGSTSSFKNDLLKNENLETNFPLNGSKVEIDFNSDEYSLTGYNGSNIIETKKFNTLANTNVTINVKDENGNTVSQTVNVLDAFKGETKFAFQQWSFQNIFFKCNGIVYQDRLILRNDDSTVYKYNNITSEYELQVGEKPIDYFSGSHISYNDITGKLWYSDGSVITKIAEDTCCGDSGGSDGGGTTDTKSDIVSVIIPEYEQSTAPTSASIGEYWFNTSDNSFYIYKQYKTETGAVVTGWQPSPTDKKFIDNDKKILYTYDEKSKQWVTNKGEEGLIYLVTNTNEILTWDYDEKEFKGYNSENKIEQSVHFVNLFGVYDNDDTNKPAASSALSGKYILEATEDNPNLYDLLICKRSSRQRKGIPTQYTWEKVKTPNYLYAIYMDSNESDYYIYNNVADGNTQQNQFVTYSEGFSENIYYIDELNGNVYAWNGTDLRLISNEELEAITIPNITINVNTRHYTKKEQEEKKLFRTPFINEITTSTDGLVLNRQLNSYKVEGQYTLTVYNSETSNRTVFDLSIWKDGNYLYQKLYTNNVEYVRYCYNNGSWSGWNPNFTKTGVSLQLIQLWKDTEDTDTIVRNWVLGDNLPGILNDDGATVTIKRIIKENRIAIKVNCKNEEFIRLNEDILTIRLYRRYNAKGRKKWRMVRPDYRIGGYYILSFTLAECERVAGSNIYILPITVKDTLNGLLEVSGSVEYNGETVNVTDLNQVMKFGCGNEYTNIKVRRKTIDNKKKSAFSTYGYDPHFTYTIKQNPSISIVLGMNLVFGANTDGLMLDATQIQPVRFKVSNYYAKDKLNINYTIDDLQTKCVIR